MDYSNPTNLNGLVEICDFLVNTDSTSYPIKRKTASANAGLERVASLILEADTRWKWDDTNETDLPVGRCDLVANQHDYGIDTTYLKILKVTCKDSNGNFQELTKKSLWDMGQDPTEFQETAGTPRYYELRGNSIFIYPQSNYASTNGLKVFYQRTVSYFTTITDVADTTEPGFASPFHKLIALYMAKDYALANDMPAKLKMLQAEIDRMEAQLMEYYATRDEDTKLRMSVHKENYETKVGGALGGDSKSLDW